MSFMAWNDKPTSGIDIVDRRYRSLVDRFNRAASNLPHSGQESPREAQPLLDGLLDHAATRFRTEEEMKPRLGMNARARDRHHDSHTRCA